MSQATTARLILKKGRERSLKNFHPWIFSGAIEKLNLENDGQLVDVYSADNEWLALAYANRKSSITARVLSFKQLPIDQYITQAIQCAQQHRAKFINFEETDGYRVVNGESDNLPGLIIDRYRDTLVMQVGTLGIELLKPLIIDQLKAAFKPSLIYEKSNLPSRKEEGMEPFEGVIYGAMADRIQFKEHAINFEFDLKHSQKTGFFLDQREMRLYVGSLATERAVLNCFCYSGAFSVYAALAKASVVDSVDVSANALAQARRNFEINNLDASASGFIEADVFEFLRTVPAQKYDCIILDPPAFAKHKKDIDAAARGYNEINRLAMQKVRSGGIIITCSCSHFIDRELFQKIVFTAARDAGRMAKIVQRQLIAADHPLSVFHPEGDYLKSLVLAVE